MNQTDQLGPEASKYFQRSTKVREAVKKAMSKTGSYYGPKKDKENGK